MNFHDSMNSNYDDDSDEEFRKECIRDEKMRIQTKINKLNAEKRHEKTETYVFYVYHEALLQPDSNDCEACNILNENERLEAHDNYIYGDNNEARQKLFNTDVSVRQKFIVNIKPTTRKLFNDEKGVSIFGVDRLAEICTDTIIDNRNSELDDEPSELDNDETIEYTNESVLVYFDEENIERDAYEYFKENNMHETSVGYMRTCMGEWGTGGFGDRRI